MRKYTKLIRNMICMVILTALVLLSCGGCAKNTATGKLSVVNGKTFYFLDDKDKQALREPLIRLLSNETREIYADTPRGELIGREPYDPDAPTVPAGYACGLYDVTGDGMPELLVHPNGYTGSSGTATYFVYDVFSGEELGSIDGGNDELWCVYYFMETDELRSVGTYWRRGGWSERYRVTSFLTYDKAGNTCGEEYYLYAHFVIESNMFTPSEDSSDAQEWSEHYPYARYSVRGENSTLDDYYGEIDWFNANCVRIPETTLQMIDWDTVCSDDDDRFVRAERMADALLSSTQEFIVSCTPKLTKPTE